MYHSAADGYLNGLTLYFVGYVLFEVRYTTPSIEIKTTASSRKQSLQIPCNIILKKTTPRIWLPTLTIVWGIVSTLLGIVENYSGFLAARFFLGVAESGLFPGVVYYFSMWYVIPMHPSSAHHSGLILGTGTNDVSANIESPCSSVRHLWLVLSAVFLLTYAFIHLQTNFHL